MLDYFDIASQHRTSAFLTMKLIFALAAKVRNPPFVSIDVNGPKRTLDHPWNAALRQVKASSGGFYNGTVFNSQCGIHMH